MGSNGHDSGNGEALVQCWAKPQKCRVDRTYPPLTHRIDHLDRLYSAICHGTMKRGTGEVLLREMNFLIWCMFYLSCLFCLFRYLITSTTRYPGGESAWRVSQSSPPPGWSAERKKGLQLYYGWRSPLHLNCSCRAPCGLDSAGIFPPRSNFISQHLIWAVIW